MVLGAVLGVIMGKAKKYRSSKLKKKCLFIVFSNVILNLKKKNLSKQYRKLPQDPMPKEQEKRIPSNL